MRVWFNKTFSSVQGALRLIRGATRVVGHDRIELVVSHTNAHAIAALAADRYFTEPSALTGMGYVEWCANLCRAEEIDVFVPGKEATLIAAHHELFSSVGTSVMSSASAATLALLHDKAAFYAGVDEGQVEVLSPDVHACTTYEGFEEAYQAMRAQHREVCIKPSQSVYGIGFRRIREDRTAYQLFSAGDSYEIDLHSLRSMLEAQGQFPELLVMEFLPGVEYSVDCIADRGQLKCAIARKKLPEGGQRIDQRKDIQRACARIVAQYGLNGFNNIQFREGLNGLRVLEVNPRMSGGIAMACLAGPNLPYLGLMGFEHGYEGLEIPLIRDGLRVAEINKAVAFE